MSDPFNFTAPPDQYAVMGNPISHSKSPQIHALFAQQTQQRMVYSAIQVDPGGFKQAVGNFRANGGKGLNVTVPFKREAWEMVDAHTARALRAGAVNTLVFDRDGTLRGDNTDGIGLTRDLRDNHGVTLRGKRVLILGAGGAVRGVLEPLLHEKPELLVIANRTVERATELETEFRDAGALHGCGFEDLAQWKFDVVINGTAASLAGDLPPLPDALLAPGACCYDMMYAAEPTVFMRWAQSHGAARNADGLGMLVEQAAESFFVWRGVRPDTVLVIAAIRASMRSTPR